MRRRAAIAALAAAFLVSPACSVTWRQPEIKPLDPTRQYRVTPAAACAAATAALAALELVVDERTDEDDSCLLQTEHRRLPETGGPVNSLRSVALVAATDDFTHGRYLVTASVRPVAGDLTRVRLTTRIEGYDAGYRLLRSRGLIEDALFERLQAQLGVAPAE